MTAVVWGLISSWVMFTVVWLWSVRDKDASVIDRVWGLAFVFNAVTTAMVSSMELSTWHYILLLMVTIWGLRLSLHIHIRNRGHGEDYRYQNMRAGYQSGFWWKSYFTIFMVQWLLSAVISAPLFFSFTSPGELFLPVALAGSVLWLIGFYFEAVGDWQLVAFKKNPENKGKLLNTGLWALTRHPNYFGDGAVWWGFYCFALAAGGWYSVIGPIVMTLMLRKVSGVDLLEKKLKSSKPGYAEYIANTPAFIPRLRLRKKV